MHPGFRPQLHGSHFPIQMHCNAWSLTSWESSPAFKPTERPPDLRRSTWTWKICCPAYQFEHYQGLSVQWQQSNWTKYLRNTTPFLATIRGWSVPITSFRCSPFWPTQVSYLGTKECPYMVTITFLPLNFPNITQNSGSFNSKPACILQPKVSYQEYNYATCILNPHVLVLRNVKKNVWWQVYRQRQTACRWKRHQLLSWATSTC